MIVVSRFSFIYSTSNRLVLRILTYRFKQEAEPTEPLLYSGDDGDCAQLSAQSRQFSKCVRKII